LKYQIIIFIFLFFISLNFIFSEDITKITFFYGDGCPHCGKVEPYISSLESKFNYLQVNKFEVYNDRNNLQLLTSYFDNYNIPINDRGVPIVFVGEKYLIGDKQILDNLEKEIEYYKDLTIDFNDGIISQPTNDSNMILEKSKIETLSILTVIGAAIVDSINPCAIAVLLILVIKWR